ncbi:bifunctional 4-hydroxy-2-oxoglutarate aldolase/2-dehydro-3-deoxy-phosphogluconate aldolase [Microbacterium aurantiacum]|nr:bifunctional 4-hydroxy-2-oxoglutarate aldolase/2-dehydro-3-deoxy-phosphogluconate aldolase [Microbacterium aurantiacum]ODT12047.1 MAG: 2-dehydro-3-deoxyphosphogluconate aldolase [Microbacterium sp. SCN 70-18]
MNRVPLPTSLTTTGIVAVLRASTASAYLPVVRALATAGVTSIELTLTTPGTIDTLPALAAAAPEAEIGIGTVLTRADAEAAADAGARFLVTPALRPAVVATAAERGVPILTGAFSPTEVHQAWELGSSAVKIFPASTVGTDYVTHLRGPFPDLVAVPSGGLALADIGGWIRAGSAAVSLGGPLLQDSLAGGDIGALAQRAADALDEVRRARR